MEEDKAPSDSGNSAAATTNGSSPSCADPAVSTFVNDFLQYRLSQNGYQWRVPPAPASSAQQRAVIGAKVGAALRSLADEFTNSYREQFSEMVGRLELSEETLQRTIEGVANELFGEGIKWARIVAFFVFGGELAIRCKDNNWPELIGNVGLLLSSYISQNLLVWINDHGGWEGLIVFNDQGADQVRNKWPSVKNLLCLGISALGAITLGAVLSKS